MATDQQGADSTGATQTRLWRDGVLVAEDFPIDEVSDHLGQDDSLVWLDLCAPNHELLDRLADELGLDPQSVEDAVAHGERPKATRHSTYNFVTAYSARMQDDADLRELDSRLVISRVSAFVLPRGLVTVRHDATFDLQEVVRRWDDNNDLLTYGSSALLYCLLDVIVDGHFETVQSMDDAIEGLEDSLFDEAAYSAAVQQRTYRLRKELVELRRIILPMREVVNAVLRHRELGPDTAGAGTELDGWYADLYDHVLRATEWTESLRDMITTIFETSLSLQDNRLNNIMKKLTSWAAIIAVPTAVTGWFGQNVPYPGFQQVSGLLISSVVILFLAGALYLGFRRRGWL